VRFSHSLNFNLGGIMEIESEILKLINEPLLKIGLKIDKVSYLREDNINFLRIVIDKEPYVNIDDCVEATKIINPIIDNANITIEPYILDICSKEKGGSK
jgi:ribosome maturation factor RimP